MSYMQLICQMNDLQAFCLSSAGCFFTLPGVLRSTKVVDSEAVRFPSVTFFVTCVLGVTAEPFIEVESH